MSGLVKHINSLKTESRNISRIKYLRHVKMEENKNDFLLHHIRTTFKKLFCICTYRLNIQLPDE